MTKKRLYIGYVDCERAENRGYHGRAVTWRRAARRPSDPHGVVTWVSARRLHANIYDPEDILERARKETGCGLQST